MRSALVVLLLAGCAAPSGESTATEMKSELIEKTEGIVSGSEYQSFAEQLGFDCRRSPCANKCAGDNKSVDETPDEILVCRWDEPLEVSFGTFGTTFSVSYLTKDEIVSTEVDVIHTGP